MSKFIEITKDNYPNQFKLLKSMEFNVKYHPQELEVISKISVHTIKNLVRFLRESINFKIEGDVYHLAKHQIMKTSFAYILRRGVYDNDDFYFPPKNTR